MKKSVINCPQCGKSALWDPKNPFRPFCSERCKTMDLAQWAQESYRIPEPEPENAAEEYEQYNDHNKP